MSINDAGNGQASLGRKARRKLPERRDTIRPSAGFVRSASIRGGRHC